MTEKEFANCISYLYDMEQDVYMKTRMIEDLDEIIADLTADLHSPDKIDKPVREIYRNELSFFKSIFVHNPVADFITEHIIYNDFSSYMAFLVGLFGVILYVFFIPINVVVGMFYHEIHNKSVRQYNSKIDERYSGDCKHYEELFAKTENEYQVELEKIENVKKQKESLQIDLSNTEEVLRNMYKAMNINVHFRGLIPISYMHEYITLGIATKLEGADGLYYLIKKELSDKEFKYAITSKLDEIIEGNNSLHTAVEYMKRSCDIMVRSSINFDSNENKLSEYQAERIRKEIEYQTYIMKKYIS